MRKRMGGRGEDDFSRNRFLMIDKDN